MILLLFLTQIFSPHALSAPIRVLSYNILVALPVKGFDPWSKRRDTVFGKIKEHAPDLLGLQEPIQWQSLDLIARFPEYQFLFKSYHPDSTLAFRKERFEMLASGFRWLSPQPWVPLSTGWGNFVPRLLVWVKLRDRETNKEFYFFNTHFDNTSPFQKKAALPFVKFVEKTRKGLPVIVTGDFNSRPPSLPYRTLTSLWNQLLLKDTYEVSTDRREWTDPNNPRDYDPSTRIDHIFVTEDFSVSKWTVDLRRYGKPLRDPSDHFAMVAELEFSP